MKTEDNETQSRGGGANVFGCCHILVIVWRLVRYQPHLISHVKRVNKKRVWGSGGGGGGGWAKNFWLIALHTGWQGPLSAKADWKACQLTTNRYLFFNLEKPSLLQIGKTWVFITWEFFWISEVKKFMGLGSHVLLAEPLLAGINIMVCWGLAKKGGTDITTTLE